MAGHLEFCATSSSQALPVGPRATTGTTTPHFSHLVARKQVQPSMGNLARQDAVLVVRRCKIPWTHSHGFRCCKRPSNLAPIGVETTMHMGTVARADCFNKPHSKPDGAGFARASSFRRRSAQDWRDACNTENHASECKGFCSGGRQARHFAAQGCACLAGLCCNQPSERRTRSEGRG